MTDMSEVISQVPAFVGVAAKHLDTGQEFRHNADEIFFTASTFKVPLLLEIYRQVDQGSLEMERRIELRDSHRVPGSGILKEMSAGTKLTLHDLVTLMIIISDNTATDILYGLVGKESLAATLDKLGLAKTSIPMTTRELLYSAVGLDPGNPSHTYQVASDRLTAGKYDLQTPAYSEWESDVSSPSDMCLLLETVHSGDVLSAASREAFFDILGRQQLKNVIPDQLPLGVRAAHKTGSYHNVRCDVGVVYAPHGPYALAIMARDVAGSRLQVDMALGRISKAIYQNFTS